MNQQNLIISTNGKESENSTSKNNKYKGSIDCFLKVCISIRYFIFSNHSYYL